MFDNVMNVEQLASFLSCSTGWIYKLVQAKQIPHYKRGKRITFKKEEIEEWYTGERVPTEKEMIMDAMQSQFKKGKR